MVSAEAVLTGSAVVLLLPEAISNGKRCELRGTVMRSSLCQTRSGEMAYATVVQYGDLDPPVRTALDKMARGEQIGAPVSPLAGAEAWRTDRLEVAELEPERSERRGAEREQYERRVLLLEETNADRSGMGCDLSVDGVRVRGLTHLEVGSKVTLALYGGSREEPVVLDASVTRKVGDDEVVFRFGQLSSDELNTLERIAGGLGRLDSLDGDGPVVVTRLVQDP